MRLGGAARHHYKGTPKRLQKTLLLMAWISPRGVMAETRHSPSGERHEKLLNSGDTRTCSRFRDLCPRFTEESLEIARRHVILKWYYCGARIMLRQVFRQLVPVEAPCASERGREEVCSVWNWSLDRTPAIRSPGVLQGGPRGGLFRLELMRGWDASSSVYAGQG